MEFTYISNREDAPKSDLDQIHLFVNNSWRATVRFQCEIPESIPLKLGDLRLERHPILRIYGSNCMNLAARSHCHIPGIENLKNSPNVILQAMSISELWNELMYALKLQSGVFASYDATEQKVAIVIPAFLQKYSPEDFAVYNEWNGGKYTGQDQKIVSLCGSPLLQSLPYHVYTVLSAPAEETTFEGELVQFQRALAPPKKYKYRLHHEYTEGIPNPRKCVNFRSSFVAAIIIKTMPFRMDESTRKHIGIEVEIQGKNGAVINSPICLGSFFMSADELHWTKLLRAMLMIREVIRPEHIFGPEVYDENFYVRTEYELKDMTQHDWNHSLRLSYILYLEQSQELFRNMSLDERKRISDIVAQKK